MKKVFIFGSCVSRDTIEFDKGAFQIIEYYARSSFASLNFPKFEGSTAFVESIESPFQRKMVKRDLAKEILHRKEDLDADFFLIDFIDERFNLVEFLDGSIATLSLELSEKIDGFFNTTEIKTMDVDYFSNFIGGFTKFIEMLGEKASKVRIIKAFWATKSNNENIRLPVSSEYISLQNKKLSVLYAIAEGVLSSQNMIQIPNHLEVADCENKWGFAPYHYCSEFYENIITQLKE